MAAVGLRWCPVIAWTKTTRLPVKEASAASRTLSTFATPWCAPREIGTTRIKCCALIRKAVYCPIKALTFPSEQTQQTATSTCVSTKCPYTNHTSFTPESATSSNCSGFTSLEHGQICSFDRPNYDCSGTEIVCGDDNTITNYPAATNGFLLQECAPLNCTFDTATMSPPGATSTNCTNTSTVLHGESCGFEREHYTCSSVLCYEGHVSSPAPCVPDPCVWDDAILPEQATSNCTVVGLQNHTLPSGSICTVYAAGYDCGDPLHCVAGRWWHYPYTSPTDATIYFNDGVFAGTVFPESDTNRIVSPRCDTPVGNLGVQVP